MTLETFQAVKFGGSKGEPGASVASWGGSGVPDGSGKEGEWGGAGRQHRPYTYSYHRHSFESATYKTSGGYWTRTLRVSLTGETALSRSFGRSEGNGTSQLLVLFIIILLAVTFLLGPLFWGLGPHVAPSPWKRHPC